MARRTFRQILSDYRGLDKRGSELTRDLDFFPEFQNFVVSSQGDALVTREGVKIYSPNGPYLGLFTSTWNDPDTGELTEEIVGLSDSLYRLEARTFVIAYAGANSPVQLNLTLDATTETFKVNIVENIASVLTTKLDYDIGTGLELAPVDLAGLKTQIDAISGGLYTATITGTTTTPAALVLPITLNADLSGGSYAMTWYEWEAVNKTVTTPFATYYASRGNDGFEHASVENLEGNLYIATGYENLHKYDGQTLYLAGCPEIDPPSLANGGAGSLTGTYTYYARYKQRDSRLTTRTFAVSIASSEIVLTADLVDVTFDNLIAGTGYNTNGALVNGAQLSITTGVTVTNTPHTMKVGDLAAIYDANKDLIVYRRLTAVTATTLSWDADEAIDVTSGHPISNGLTIEIFRNKDGGTLPYLQSEWPNNCFAATQTIEDDITDANLGESIDLPQKTPDLLTTKPKYLREHQGMLITAGAVAEPNTVRYSDVENIEGFPAASNIFDVTSTSKGGITGLISDYERLIVGKEFSLYSYAGDLDLGGVIPQKIGDGAVGIACHNSIADTEFGVMFLTRVGFRRIRYGQVEDMGDDRGTGGPLDPYFTDPAASDSEQLQVKRVWGVILDGQQIYLCFVPAETGSGTGRYANDYSKIFYFDWGQRIWGEWTGINAAGGIAVQDRLAWYLSKRSDTTLTVTGNAQKTQNSGTEHDYADHYEAIEPLVGTSWDSLGQPSLLKKVLYLKLYNLFRGGFSAAFTVDVQSEVNYVRSNPHSETSLTFGTTSSGGWGYGAWGIFSWGTPSVKTRRTKLKPARVTAIRFLLSNDRLHERTTISGIEYEVAGAYNQEIKE
jgi:hypothetical protein